MKKSTHSLDIEKTIDALEQTIHMSTHTSGKKTSNIPRYNDSRYQFRQRMVWSTVIFLGIGIFGMWGWHMRTVFYDAAKGTLGKTTPFDTAGQQFDEAMKIAGAQDNTDIPSPIPSSTVQALLTEEEEADNAIPTSTIDTLISTLKKQHTTTSTSEISLP